MSDQFTAAVGAAMIPQACYDLLAQVVRDTVGARLITVMEADIKANTGRRAYSSDPLSYPVSGTKPLPEGGDWVDTVVGQNACYVMNTLTEIAQLFPDHELINALGCQSCVNMPITVEGTYAGTLNLLHEAGYYTPERVARIDAALRLPAAQALARARDLTEQGVG